MAQIPSEISRELKEIITNVFDNKFQLKDSVRVESPQQRAQYNNEANNYINVLNSLNGLNEQDQMFKELYLKHLRKVTSAIDGRGRLNPQYNPNSGGKKSRKFRKYRKSRKYTKSRKYRR
jgi:hypothetical protein